MNGKAIRAIGAAGALFNLVGVQAYLAHVGVFGAEAAAPPGGGPAMPILVTAAFAIAVFGGVIGSVGLLLLKAWERPVLWLTFVASVINWAWVFAYRNDASIPLGVTVIMVSLVLAVVAERTRRVG